VTVSSAESRVLASGTLLLPRVNLLPPEIAEKAAFRKVQIGLGATLVAAVGVVGMLYASAGHSVSSAQSRLDASSAQGRKLQAETAKYRDVTSLYADAAAAKAQLSTAMGDEVRFSQLLNDLSLSTPSNVWIKNLTATAATGGGSLTIGANAFSHDDVALWLESLANLKTYANPYFSTSAEGLIGTRKVITFSSTATLTPAALSGRYAKPAGG
jgi:Tfp pilus assembly protein PilN